jgi:hypothetical protein
MYEYQLLNKVNINNNILLVYILQYLLCWRSNQQVSYHTTGFKQRPCIHVFQRYVGKCKKLHFLNSCKYWQLWMPDWNSYNLCKTSLSRHKHFFSSVDSLYRNLFSIQNVKSVLPTHSDFISCSLNTTVVEFVEAQNGRQILPIWNHSIFIIGTNLTVYQSKRRSFHSQSYCNEKVKILGSSYRNLTFNEPSTCRADRFKPWWKKIWVESILINNDVIIIKMPIFNIQNKSELFVTN